MDCVSSEFRKNDAFVTTGMLQKRLQSILLRGCYRQSEKQIIQPFIGYADGIPQKE